MMKPEDNPTTRGTSVERTGIRTAEELRNADRRAGAGAGKPTTLTRRAFLRSMLTGVAGVATGALVSGCTDFLPRGADDAPTSTPAQTTATERAPTQPTMTATEPAPLTTTEPAPPTATEPAPAAPTAPASKALLVYFSRAGENYYYGGRTQLEVGNTEVVAGMIRRIIGCDVHRIEPADPYPDDYAETRARNVQEQEANARPAIANPLASIDQYSTVLLGSPIWNVRAPMIMSTFVEGFDFTGKTVLPFTTYAVSGLGTTVRDYTASCPGATIGEGLAVQGEKVQDADPDVAVAVESWLRRIGLLTG